MEVGTGHDSSQLLEEPKLVVKQVLLVYSLGGYRLLVRVDRIEKSLEIMNT